MEYQHWLRETVNQPQASEGPRRGAEILLKHVAGRGRIFILAFGEAQLTDEQCRQLDVLLACCRGGEPIAHPTKVREFWSLPLLVSPATLTPRPNMKRLVEQALTWLSEQPCRILDLGTDTGATALALANGRSDCKITAVGHMPGAVSLAQRNTQHLAIKNIHIPQSDQFSALAGQQSAMIVSSPPYVDEQDPHLQQSDVRFEPLTALVAADNGMTDIVHTIEQSRSALVSGGFLLLEHGWRQGEVV